MASVAQLGIFAFQTAWWPFAYAKAREPGHRDLYARILIVSAGALAAGGVFVGLFAHEAIILVTDTVNNPAYASAYPYVGMLAMALVIHGTYQVISIAVALVEGTIHLAWTSGLAAVINLSLNLLLIPRIGLYGASASTLIAFAASTLLLFFVAQHANPMPYRLKPIGAMAIAAAIVLPAGLYLDGLSAATTWLPLVTLAKLGIYLGFLAVVFLAVRQNGRRAPAPRPADDGDAGTGGADAGDSTAADGATAAEGQAR